jgi:branched-subunit amino acid aminotransferase/4-amino-4-deoxychorismate lyase
MRLSVDDLGIRQGVIAVERLRTYRGRICALQAHLRRWHWTTSQLGLISLPSLQSLAALLDELLRRNEELVQCEGDVGIVLFATPGCSVDSGPSLAIHLNRLNHQAIHHRRECGQPLVVTAVEQPSPQCWPRTIKTRCRLHYYLADAAASQHQPDSLGVLLDQDGSVTETSTSNLAIVSDGQVFSPPDDRVLAGITQQIVERLSQELSIPWIKTAIHVPKLMAADEVWLMGTDGGIWFANSVNDRVIADGRPGEIFRAVSARFDQAVVGAIDLG